jgi:phage host-nuclease inhibitor protein Gam
MTYQTGAAETERLRTEVEELTNALQRVLEALRDEGLTEAERATRSAAIATVVLERQ